MGPETRRSNTNWRRYRRNHAVASSGTDADPARAHGADRPGDDRHHHQFVFRDRRVHRTRRREAGAVTSIRSPSTSTRPPSKPPSRREPGRSCRSTDGLSVDMEPVMRTPTVRASRDHRRRRAGHRVFLRAGRRAEWASWLLLVLSEQESGVRRRRPRHDQRRALAKRAELACTAWSRMITIAWLAATSD